MEKHRLKFFVLSMFSDKRKRLNFYLGDNNARILYYELQYNTSFQPNDWISVPVEQQREYFKEVKLPDGSITLETKITSTNYK